MPQIMRHAFERDPESPLLNYETRCPCGLQYCRITPEGKLTPCPYSPAVAGDLRTQRFADVWRDSPVFTALRGGLLEGKCGRCEYREICGGCRARAYAQTGDLLGRRRIVCVRASRMRASRSRVAMCTVRRVSASTPRRCSGRDEARARVQRIPSFVRNVVIQRIETFAREHGHDLVTAEMMTEIRKAMPVDFSKRLPFFARSDEQ